MLLHANALNLAPPKQSVNQLRVSTFIVTVCLKHSKPFMFIYLVFMVSVCGRFHVTYFTKKEVVPEERSSLPRVSQLQKSELSFHTLIK